MKILLRIVSILLISSSSLFGQIHEFGISVGGTNAIADVGSELFVNPNNIAFGGMYRWNRSPRHSYRFSAMHTQLSGDDAKSQESRRKERGYAFKNTLTELTAGMEFTFLEFDLHEYYSQRLKTTPYLFTGISYVSYSALALDAGEILPYNSHTTLAMPMAVGIKTMISRQLILSFEINARYTFTDDLDGSNPVRDKEEYESLKFGNLNTNDWYVFTGVTLTYTFGKNPCFCNY